MLFAFQHDSYRKSKLKVVYSKFDNKWFRVYNRILNSKEQDYQMDYELDFDFLFNVYTVTINGDIVLTGTDDYEEAREYAEQLAEELCQG